MNINYKNLINEYRNYLIMLKVNTTKVNMSIKSIRKKVCFTCYGEKIYFFYKIVY